VIAKGGMNENKNGLLFKLRIQIHFQIHFKFNSL